MNLRLSALTDPAAVQAALDEFAALGQAEFLERYGFGTASGYVVRDPKTGGWADSKAIAGVALAFQYPGSGGLKAADFSGGEATVLPRLTSLGFEVKTLVEVRGQDWSREEVALIVADYLSMLTSELTGQSFNKSARRRRLQEHLPGRSEGSIEFKHANISAVMLELGYPYLKGYKPRSNFQRSLLVDEVAAQVARHNVLDEAALSATQRPAIAPDVVDFSRVRSDPPERELVAREPASPRAPIPQRRDYLAREAQNRSLGEAGEIFAVSFERWRLAQSGASNLADKVEHVSKSMGDGLGFDILSFDVDGRERFIEVKTTTFGQRTPFFVSSNEVRFARDHAEQFKLYRLFDFRASPKMFELGGSIESHCHLDAATFRASFG